VSDVKAIRERIEQEIESTRSGMSGLSTGSARHEFIQDRLENMSRTYEQLEPLIGQDRAVEILSSVMERMYEQVKAVEEQERMDLSRLSKSPVLSFSRKSKDF
jgi:hypothetical protein